MAVELTSKTISVLEQTSIGPRLVFKIEDYPTFFSTSEILESIKIGDTNLYLDGSWNIGGGRAIPNQLSYVTLDGTTTTINQQLSQDRGTSSSVSSIQISLLDKNNTVSALISPGIALNDVIGKRGRFWLGFEGTSYPEDYVLLFNGQIMDIEAQPGKIRLTIDHPDQKKRQKIFVKGTTSLTSSINASATNAPVANVAPFVTPLVTDFITTCCIRIGDEIMKYTGTFTGPDEFVGLTRGYLGTIAASHDVNADVETFFIFEGNPIDIALRMMLSGPDAYHSSGIAAGKIGYDEAGNVVANAVYVPNVNLVVDYGLRVGDTVLFTSGPNNGVICNVFSVVVESDGSYFISDMPLVSQLEATSTLSIRSRYNTMVTGLGMSPLDVDIDQFEQIKDKYVSLDTMKIYVRDTIEAKDFIEKELLLPVACYNLPRKAKSSVGYTAEPLPGTDTVVLNESNIKNPSKVIVRRSVAKNFFNTILYQFDEQVLYEKFSTAVVSIESGSVDRIPVGAKTLEIKSKGLRSSLGGVATSSTSGRRKLSRYGYGAEYIENIEVLFSTGFSVEIGDVVLLDSTNMSMVNSKTGDRTAFQRLYEVSNKSIDVKTGAIKLSLVDTRFSNSNRYGTISPASYVDSVIDARTVIIKPSFNSRFGLDEWRKWAVGYSVVFRNSSYTVESAPITISKIVGNKIFFASDISITPAANYVMEFSKYDYLNGVQTNLHASLSGVNFADGTKPYAFY